jgi:hypothetical protein
MLPAYRLFFTTLLRQYFTQLKKVNTSANPEQSLFKNHYLNGSENFVSVVTD